MMPTSMAWNEAAIPKDMKDLDQWVCWKKQTRLGKVTKVPISASRGGCARTNDRSTWASFVHASGSAEMCGLDGIGFVFTKEDPYVGIDLDNCLVNGEPELWAVEVLNRYKSYTEVSQSGKGLHIICKMKVPFTGRHVNLYQSGRMEVYAERRFFIMTGVVWDGRNEINKTVWRG